MKPIKHLIDCGDVLSSIALKYGVSIDDIVRLNPAITNVDFIRLGHELLIPETGVLSDTEVRRQIERLADDYAAAFPSRETARNRLLSFIQKHLRRPIPFADESREASPTPEQQWNEHWKAIVCNEDGSINIEQLKLELSDAAVMESFASRVYMHATGGQVSKVNTFPSVVCSLIDEHIEERCEEAVKEAECQRAGTWRHVKTGDYYEVIAESHLEVDRKKRMVTYQALKDGILWTRPADEFYDGRFVQDAPSLEPETLRQAANFRIICALAGYVEDGSSRVLTIFQDDATKDWFVKIDERSFVRPSLEKALDDANHWLAE